MMGHGHIQQVEIQHQYGGEAGPNATITIVGTWLNGGLPTGPVAIVAYDHDHFVGSDNLRCEHCGWDAATRTWPAPDPARCVIRRERHWWYKRTMWTVVGSGQSFWAEGDALVFHANPI